MERLLRAALAATLSILLVAGGSLALTQAGPDDLATLQAAPWTLSELDGESIAASAGITAAFGADGSLTGSAGCNSYFGDYAVDGEFLSVSPLASTRMACDQVVMDAENLFLTLLETAETWLLDGSALIITSADGGELVFGGEGGEPAPFTGTGWVLVTFDGDTVPVDLGITATFAEDFTVGGLAGCNDYNGGYAIDGSSIAIGPLAATRKACDQAVMDIENAYLLGMEQVSTLALSGDTLTLTSDDGTTQLVFTADGSAPTPGQGTLTGVTWSVVDLDGQPAQVADGMTVTFGEDGSVDGYGGCNTIFGSYTADDSTITMDGLASTRMFCEDSLMEREGLFIGILTTAVSYRIEGDELTITAADGAEVILTAGDPATPTGGIVGPVWQLAELQGQPIPGAIIEVTIRFGADGTLSGNGGCNDFTGSYELGGESLSLSDIELGSETCDTATSGVEQALMQIFPFVDRATLVDGELHLDSSFGIETVWQAQ